MIPFEEIDRRLFLINKDRTWLAKTATYSEAAVREALAPNSKKRSGRIQAALSEAIEAEEKKQADAGTADLEKIILRPTESQFDRWETAAREQGFGIKDWAIKGLDKMAKDYFANMADNASFSIVAEEATEYGKPKERDGSK